MFYFLKIASSVRQLLRCCYTKIQIEKNRYSFKVSPICPYILEGRGECYTDHWYEKKSIQINDISRQNYLTLLLWREFIVKVVLIFSGSPVSGERKNVKEQQTINFKILSYSH